MNDITFYNRTGKPVAYTDDDIHIFLFGGQAVAYIDSTSVFGYSGKHLGWFDAGLIRDHNGHCVLFTEKATGGPAKPVKSAKPVKGVKQMKPVKGVKQAKPVRAPDIPSWSTLSGDQFFNQLP